jgi:hypothetical protein
MDAPSDARVVKDATADVEPDSGGNPPPDATMMDVIDAATGPDAAPDSPPDAPSDAKADAENG